MTKEKLAIFGSWVTMNDDLEAKFSSVSACTRKDIIVVGPPPDISVRLLVFNLFQHLSRNIDMGSMHDRSRPDHGEANFQIAYLWKCESQINRLLKRGIVNAVRHIFGGCVAIVFPMRNKFPSSNGMRGFVSNELPFDFCQEHKTRLLMNIASRMSLSRFGSISASARNQCAQSLPCVRPSCSQMAYARSRIACCWSSALGIVAPPTTPFLLP